MQLWPDIKFFLPINNMLYSVFVFVVHAVTADSVHCWVENLASVIFAN